MTDKLNKRGLVWGGARRGGGGGGSKDNQLEIFLHN